MALTALPKPIFYGPSFGTIPTNSISSIGSDSTVVFDAAGDGIAFVFQASSTTVPDQVSFHIITATTPGTTGTIDCKLETVAADGTPSGTLITNSATASTNHSTTGIKTNTGMAGTATVAVGDFIALVIRAGSGWNRNLTLKVVTGATNQNGFPYHLTNTAASWVKSGANTGGYCIGLADSGGAAIQNIAFAGPYSAFAAQSFSDSTNPDERGNRFVAEVDCTCAGIVVEYSGGSTPGTNDNYAVSLYSSHTGTPSQLATQACDGDAQVAGFFHMILFPSPVNLDAGTTYCVALKACGSDSASFPMWTFSSSALRETFAGSNFYATSRDGGTGNPAGGGNSFSDSNTTVYAIWPLISKFDDGAGGGGTTISGTPMRRGMV